MRSSVMSESPRANTFGMLGSLPEENKYPRSFYILNFKFTDERKININKKKLIVMLG